MENGYNYNAIKEKPKYCKRVTQWMSLGHHWFFDEITEMIKNNHGDDTCIKTNGAGKIALFRTMNGFSKVEDRVSNGERAPIKKRKYTRSEK